jgi:hypothetical protein
VSATEHMRNVKAVATTKASQDFRHTRSLPLAGLGTITGLVWGSQKVFGADLSGAGTELWAIGALVVVFASACTFLLAAKIQREDEVRLRAMFDPDIQAEALRFTVERVRSFTRRLYRPELFRQTEPRWHNAMPSVNLDADDHNFRDPDDIYRDP